jgi:hypothetical protein
LLQKLEPLDKLLAEKLSIISVNINSSSNLSYIQDTANTALASLLVPNKMQEKRYLKFRRTVESKDFILSKEKYANILHLIEATQPALERAEKYVQNLHLPIERGKYANCLHARVTKNIRIMYIVDPEQKKLIYIDIISKNDFDTSLRAKPADWIEKYKEL